MPETVIRPPVNWGSRIEPGLYFALETAFLWSTDLSKLHEFMHQPHLPHPSDDGIRSGCLLKDFGQGDVVTEAVDDLKLLILPMRLDSAEAFTPPPILCLVSPRRVDQS